MHQIVRIGCGVLAATALAACVVVPERRPPPPAYSREYRAAPPPPQARVEIGFHERQREMARQYYRENDRHRERGHERERDEERDRGCPPGLAKKHNGCMPPGQAQKWRRGEPLPRDVVVQTVPRDLEVRIGPPPRGYRYVDVAGDILMIAIGTAVVVDAIQDLNR